MKNSTLVIFCTAALILSLTLTSCNSPKPKQLSTFDLDQEMAQSQLDSASFKDTLESELRFRISDLSKSIADSIFAGDSSLSVGNTIRWNVRQAPLENNPMLTNFSTDTIIKKYRTLKQREFEVEAIYPKQGAEKGSIKEWYELQTNPNYQQAAARSVCLIPRESLALQADGTYQLKASTFTYSAWPLCESEQFRDQPFGGFCSGFAVNRNQIVTAGHCVINNESLKKFYVVFNFQKNSPADTKTIFTVDEVYIADDIVKRTDSSDFDFAILRVNRPMKINSFAKIRSSKITLGESIFVAGHPCGWPIKVADLAKTTRVPSERVFYTDLDTFQGNSGSAVYDVNSNIIGILLKGSKDFDKKQLRKCYTTHVCAPYYSARGCPGELVSSTIQFAKYITP